MKTTTTTRRRVRPHKGGRTARAPEARITPDTLAALRQLAANGESFADWLTRRINEALSGK